MIHKSNDENVPLSAEDLLAVEEAGAVYLSAVDMIPDESPEDIAKREAEHAKRVKSAAEVHGAALGQAIKDALAPVVEELKAAVQPQPKIRKNLQTKKKVLRDKFGRIEGVIEDREVEE